MFDGDVCVVYCGIDDVAFGVALPDPGDRRSYLRECLASVFGRAGLWIPDALDG